MLIKTGMAVLLATLLAATGATCSSASRVATPRLITLSSTGKTIVLRTGSTALLRLDHKRWNWSTPRVQGTTLRLEPIDYERDPGFDEWKIKTRKAGRATIAVSGKACTTCTVPDRVFRVTIVVAAN